MLCRLPVYPLFFSGVAGSPYHEFWARQYGEVSLPPLAEAR